MMKEPRWCNWPHREFAAEIDGLYTLGSACDAWRRFMVSDTLHALRRVKGHFIWFNRYQQFSELIAEFRCSERSLRRTMKRLLLPGRDLPEFAFRRCDIYDSRAWARLPLRLFTEVDPRVDPAIRFGLLDSPWTVSKSCFKVHRRMKKGRRIAVMTFDHPLLDGRFEHRRWVGEMPFPNTMTRAEVVDALFETVTETCANHNVMIVDGDAK